MGIRGVPASHGGFETFAEQLALYLMQRGWEVTVYCQTDGGGQLHDDIWCGVRRIHIPVSGQGPAGTVVFDWKATLHAIRETELCLTLGYNTAVFGVVLRAFGVPNVMNMDGIEWARAKWGRIAKIWFYLNDWAGCWLGNHLVADHPEIGKHLMSRVREGKITMIPYGADPVESASEDAVAALGLQPGRYLTLIARPEPENSILEIVRAFSRRPRGYDLAVLGNYDADRQPYHRSVMSCASKEVKFLGAIYQKDVVQALRFHSALYVHGHQVGGTNPSLVEALGASCPVLAHDNRFNRWVAGNSARYFADEAECADQLDEILNSEDLRASMRAGSRRRFHEAFTWPDVLKQYEELLTRFAAAR